MEEHFPNWGIVVTPRGIYQSQGLGGNEDYLEMGSRMFPSVYAVT